MRIIHKGGGGHDFIAYLDDDDEWMPEKMDHQLKRFTSDIGLVYCRQYYIDDMTGEVHEAMKPCREGKLYDTLMRENVVGSPSCVMVRTECLKAVDGFDVGMTASEDHDLWVRLAEKYNIGFVDEALVKYHDNHGEHNDNFTNRLKGLEYFYHKHKEYIQSHRYIHCKKLSAMSRLSRKTGQYKKALYYWLRSLPLQPFRLWAHIKGENNN